MTSGVCHREAKRPWRSYIGVRLLRAKALAMTTLHYTIVRLLRRLTPARNDKRSVSSRGC